MTKLASKLPEGGHGLETISHLLVSRPHERHVVIGVVDCSTVTTNHDNGSVEPQARFRRVEVISEPTDLEQGEQILRRMLDKRLGATVLPMSIEDDITAAFGNGHANDFAPDDEGAAADLQDDDELQPLRKEISDALEELRKAGLFKYGRARRILQLAREAFDRNDQEG